MQPEAKESDELLVGMKVDIRRSKIEVYNFATRFNLSEAAIDVHYFIILQSHYYHITTCYYSVTTILLLDYCNIITQLLRMDIHYFILLQRHYYLITSCY